MAFVLDDRCRETSTAPGTGSFTMNGAVQGAQTFASALTSNADTTWYAATNGTAWETGLLTRTSATVFARTTIFRSTNGNAAVNFSTGAVDVFCDVPGSKAKVLERLLWAAAAVTPPTNDSTALGTAALMFSDLFLADGGVINWNNGDVLATQSTNALAFTGASSGYSFDALLNLSGAAAGQISFPAAQNASAGANTLDDYEEGTWTPSIGGNATYTSQIGTYTKIGRQVLLICRITINALGTGSATDLSGAPFAAAATTSGSVGLFLSSAVNATFMGCYIITSTIKFTTTAAAVASMTNPASVFGNSADLFFQIPYSV